MPAYLCRWPNGDVSVVSASTEVEVADVLDEVDNPDEAELIELGHPIAFHFRLGDKSNGEELPLEYEGMNEDLEDSILERAYPIFNEVLHSDDVTDARLSTALEHEKNPIYSKQPDLSEDPAAANIQQQLGMPKVLVEHFTQNAMRENNVPANFSDADVRKVLVQPGVLLRSPGALGLRSSSANHLGRTMDCCRREDDRAAGRRRVSSPPDRKSQGGVVDFWGRPDGLSARGWRSGSNGVEPAGWGDADDRQHAGRSLGGCRREGEKLSVRGVAYAAD